MASYVVQAGTSLYKVSRTGVITAVTLPTGVTLLGVSTPCRIALFGRELSAVIVVVNGASSDFYILDDGTAYPLALNPPTTPPTLAIGASTGLTGAYRVAVSFKIKDPATGALIAESAVTDLATAVTLSDDSLKGSGVPVSENSAVNARGIYRTLSGGTLLYPWFDMDGNTSTTFDRAGTDAQLSLLPATATSNGAPPGLSKICSWKDRLWGVPKNAIDNVRWSEDRAFYAWPNTNELIVPPVGIDAIGVTGFIPRRDQLGIGRSEAIYFVTGDSTETFNRLQLSETLGLVSQESVVVQDNIAYFLSKQGVIEWSDAGAGLISDAQVFAWFNTDTYFNRAEFDRARGRYNPDTDAYELLLCAAGSTDLNRWVAFHRRTRAWYGPHITAAFTPSATGTDSGFHGVIKDTNDLPITVFGSTNGFLSRRDTTTKNDWTGAVSLDCTTPFLCDGDPEREKVWIQPSVLSLIQAAGTLTVTPSVGGLNASAGTAISHTLTTGRQRLRRLGLGRFVKLNFLHNTVAEGCRIFGVFLPYTIRGRR